MRDRIVAHRGNASEFRENSIAAIESAIQLGCRFVEFDVQVSKDGVPVLSHDPDLRRSHGLSVRIDEAEAASLLALGIDSLPSAAALLKQRDDVLAFVELKAESLSHSNRDAVIAAILEILEPSQFVIISFDWRAALLARENGYRIGLVLPNRLQVTDERCRHLSPEYVFCSVQLLHGPVWSGPTWVAYEVPDHQTMNAMDRYGVHLFETMNVRKLLQ